jgi:hypothetical protein
MELENLVCLLATLLCLHRSIVIQQHHTSLNPAQNQETPTRGAPQEILISILTTYAPTAVFNAFEHRKPNETVKDIVRKLDFKISEGTARN